MVIGKVEAMGVFMVEYIMPSPPLIAAGYKARKLACLAFMIFVRVWPFAVALPSGAYNRFALIDAKLWWIFILGKDPPLPAPYGISSGLFPYRFPNWSAEFSAAHMRLISLAVVALY